MLMATRDDEYGSDDDDDWRRRWSEPRVGRSESCVTAKEPPPSQPAWCRPLPNPPS